MPRAKKRCPQPGCREYAPCRTHQVWKPSSGTRALPSDWKSRKKKAKGFTEKRCYLCNRISPNGAVDHIVNRASGGTDDPSNLAWACHPCHAAKTEREKQAGRKRRS